MTRKMLVADLLCGAGGSSTGCAQALAELGLEMELVCVNHWPVAIDTHTRNHPRARHHCQDIATVRPHRVVPEGYLDLLMASPSCTHHSVARGGKPTSDQQRSDPWHILTWLTELDVASLIIENVWEFIKWGPVDAATGKPIKAREGQYFNLWIYNLRSLGYEPEWRRLNAADYGEATTRQRFILFAKKNGRSLSWPVQTHGKGAARAWRPAREIIDWSIKGKSIFNRPVPLVPKTLARILAGALKFAWPDILIAMLLAEIDRSLLYFIRYSFERRHCARGDLRRRHRICVGSYAGWLRRLRAESRPPQSGCGSATEPMLVTLRNHADGRSVELPVPALAAGGTHIGLAEPIIINGRRGNKGKGISAEPVPTLDTKGGVWLAEPFILNRHGDGYSKTRAHSIDAPAPTANCDGGGYLIEPFVLSQASGGAPRATSEPLPTAATGGAIALISPYYGSGSGDSCSTVESPLPTATGVARFGLVVPITHSDGSNRARNVETDPLPTLTTAHRGEQALVEATAEHDILFRMLVDHELAAAMGFNSDDQQYEFAGTKTEKIKQIGNAVSVKLMKACVLAMMADAVEQIAEAAE